MPGFDGVGPVGQSVREMKASVRSGGGKEWMVHDADVGEKPRMRVALDTDEVLGLIESDIVSVAGGEPQVPLAIGARSEVEVFEESGVIAELAESDKPRNSSRRDWWTE